MISPNARWSEIPIRTITGTARSGTIPTHPPIQKITMMKMKTNGRSISAVMVAEVMNSRNASNS